MDSFSVIKKIRIEYFLLLLLVLGCGGKETTSSNLQVYGTVDTTETTIGDVIHFQVWAQGTGDRLIQFPDLKWEDNRISIKRGKDLKREQKDDYGIEFEMTFWDTGTFEIPSYSVNIMFDQTDSIDYSISTDPIQIKVQTVIKDQQPHLRDIKQPVPIPMVIPYKLILSIVTLLLLIGVFIWLWKQRNPPVFNKENLKIPLKPPYDIAIEKLSNLRTNSLLSPQDIKEFYSGLSYIIREFIENQFFIRAIEMTTTEIVQAKHLIPIENDGLEQLLRILNRADLTKFAKFLPDRKQCLKDVENVETIIQSTRLDWQEFLTNV